MQPALNNTSDSAGGGLRLRHLPGQIDVLDACHPDHLDWRQVSIAIDLIEGRWFHILIGDKPGGRKRQDLEACRLFQLSVNNHLASLAEAAFPQKDKDVLPFAGDMIYSKMPEKVKTAGINFSIHVNAVSQRFMQELSNHQWLVLDQAWLELSSQLARQRAAQVR